LAQLKLRNTIVYTVLGFLPLSFSLLFTPIYTQYLSKEEYGLLNLFKIISGLLVAFSGLGIDQAAGYLYWDYNKDKKKLNEFVSTTLSIVFFTGLIIFILGFLFGPALISIFLKNGEHFKLWPFLLLALLYPLFTIQSRILLSYYRNEGNIKSYASLNLLTLLLVTTGSVTGVILLKKGAAGAVEGRTIGFCGIVLLYIIYEIYRKGISFNKKLVLPLLKLALPLFFSTLVGSVAYLSDRIIVEQLGTLDMLGIYGFSVTIASVLEILMGALSNSFIPTIYKTMLHEEEDQYKNTHFQLFLFMYIMVAAVASITAIIIPFTLLFISTNYIESIRYIPLLCLSFIPRSFTQIFSLKFYKKKKTTYVLWLNIFYLISIIGLGALLYHFFELKGIALSVFVTALINMLISYLLSKKIDSFDFKFQKIYVVSLIVSASVLVISFFPQPDEYRILFYFLPLIIFIVFSSIILKKENIVIKTYFVLSLRKFVTKLKP
jgi:O-antigen/teichoic acid export membrane protein